MRNPKNLLTIDNLIIIFVTGLVCFSCQARIPLPTISIPTPTPPASIKLVISNSLPLVEKWRWSGLIHNSFGPPIVSINQGRIIIATRADFGNEKVVVFDARLGNVIWESNPISNLRSLHTDDTRVYIGTIRSVQAYNLETGQELWEGAKQPSFKRGGFEVYSKDEHLEVYDPYNSRLYLLDNKTGQTIEEIQRSLLFFKKDNIYFFGICGTSKMTCLNATNALTGEALWSIDFAEKVHSWPVFIEDNMFINAGGRLLAVGVRTGEITWQSTGASFVTPPALGDNLLYAIRNDAAIVGFEPETGKQMGIIEIGPSQNLEYTGGYVPYYTIAASDKFVAAYYSNSQELIVFEKVSSVKGDNE